MALQGEASDKENRRAVLLHIAKTLTKEFVIHMMVCVECMARSGPAL